MEADAAYHRMDLDKALRDLKVAFESANPGVIYNLGDYCVEIKSYLDFWFPVRAKALSRQHNSKDRSVSDYSKRMLSDAFGNCPIYRNHRSDKDFEYRLWHTRLIIFSLINFFKNVPPDFSKKLMQLNQWSVMWSGKEFHLLPVEFSFTNYRVTENGPSGSRDSKVTKMTFTEFSSYLDFSKRDAVLFLKYISGDKYLGSESLAWFVSRLGPAEAFSNIENKFLSSFKYHYNKYTPKEVVENFEYSNKEFIKLKLSQFLKLLEFAEGLDMAPDPNIKKVDSLLDITYRYIYGSGARMKEVLIEDLGNFRDGLG